MKYNDLLRVESAAGNHAVCTCDLSDDNKDEFD